MSTTLVLHHDLQTPFDMVAESSNVVKVAPLTLKFAVTDLGNSATNYYNNTYPNKIPIPDFAVGDIFTQISSQQGTRRFALNRTLGTIYKEPLSTPFFVDGSTRLNYDDEVTCNWQNNNDGGVKSTQRVTIDDNSGNDYYLGDLIPVPSYDFDPNDSTQILITSITYAALYAKNQALSDPYDGSFTVQNSNKTAVVRLGVYSQWKISIPWNRNLVYGPYTDPRYVIQEYNVTPKLYRLCFD